MKLKKINSQNRRDFWADFECEFCKHLLKDVEGYDDRYFHDNVIPEMDCKECGKSTNSERGTADKGTTRYPEGLQI